MSHSQPSAVKTVAILIRYRWRRWLNSFPAANQRSRHKAAGAQSGAIVTGLVSIVMAAASFAMSRGILERLNDQYNVAAFTLGARVIPGAYLSMVGLFLGLMLLQALLLNLGFTEIAKSEWDLEWLITFPMSRWSLIFGRILERGIVNPALFLATYPTLFYLFAQVGLSVGASALMALLLYLPCAIMIGSLLVAGDTGLRLRFGPSRLKNMQIFFRLSSVAILILIFSTSEGVPPMMIWLERQIGFVIAHSPSGILVEVALRHGHTTNLAILLCVEVALCTGACIFFLESQLRQGVTGGAGFLHGRQKNPKLNPYESQERRSRQGQIFGRMVSPLVVREMRLLSRDHTYLVQTLIAPIFVMAIQLLAKHELFSGGQNQLRTLAAATFFSASYSLLFTALQCLDSEGEALWILYTFPRSLKSIVVLKMRLWFAVALFFFLLMAGFAAAQQSEFGSSFYWFFSIAFVGLGLFTLIATAMGILAFKEPTANQRQRHRLSVKYGYLLLSGIFSSAFFLPGHIPAAGVVALMAICAALLWRRATLRLVTLADASARAAVDISLAPEEKEL